MNKRIRFPFNFNNYFSYTQEGVPLLSPQDILTLSQHKCYIVAQGHSHKPLSTNIAFWFNDHRLKKLVKQEAN